MSALQVAVVVSFDYLELATQTLGVKWSQQLTEEVLNCGVGLTRFEMCLEQTQLSLEGGFDEILVFFRPIVICS